VWTITMSVLNVEFLSGVQSVTLGLYCYHCNLLRGLTDRERITMIGIF
jgi:hypothetical protein